MIDRFLVKLMVEKMHKFLKSSGHYAVVGLGASGLSAVRFLHKQGYRVSVTDGGTPTTALPDGVATYFGGLDGDLLKAVDGVVISPGVSPKHPAILGAIHQGVPVVSDVQVFVEVLKARDQQNNTDTPIVAITGSNAKSTVTTLVGLMAEQAGKVVGVGGNIGTPALDLLEVDGMEMAVLELSSFQLEMMTGLGATVATILNLSADHLDRHEDMADYLAQKLRIFDGTKSAVVWLDDKALARACIAHLPKGCELLSTSGEIGEGFSADFCLKGEGDKIWLCHHGEKLLSADDLYIKGKHNLTNALSALALGKAVGLPMDAMLKTLQTFKGLPHRCEFVATVHDKAYFNDSKGTNIGATISAIDGLGAVYGEQSLALILGGQGKGQDFTPLRAVLREKAKAVLLLGVDAAAIRRDVQDCGVPLYDCADMPDAVQQAYALASAGDTVLLSPACASLDMFKGYAHRAEAFIAAFEALPEA